MVKTMSTIPEINQRWILSGAGIILVIITFLGGMVSSTQQEQIKQNQERIWSLQSTAVTDDKLDRQIKQVQDYIDVRIQSLESSQREMSRQLTVLVNDTKESRQETRKALEDIREHMN